ncbi:hypothetical protein [Sedimenticola selenatireducens]|uniref:hypothetical protein n=1 Tax=Sedimenticola selenatireducens TaxID=191960 RepID=UPI0012F7C4CC|nr:hypothetical protein [Sedimenticola selenatireducens]
MFPSIENDHAINLALPAATFDSKFEVLFTEVYEIKETYGFGLYKLKKLHFSSEVYGNGDINWDSKKAHNFNWHPRAGLMANQPIAGWRKSKS